MSSGGAFPSVIHLVLKLMFLSPYMCLSVPWRCYCGLNTCFVVCTSDNWSVCVCVCVYFFTFFILLFSRHPSFFTTHSLLLIQMHLDSSSQVLWGPSLTQVPLIQGLFELRPQCGAAAGSCTCSGSYTPLCSPPWRESWTRWCGSGRTGMKRWVKQRSCSCLSAYEWMHVGAGASQ